MPTPPETPEPSKKRPRRTHLILGAVFLLFLAAVAWRLWSTRGYRHAEGIYLVDGGQSFVQIETTPFRGVRIVDGAISADLFWSAPEYETRLDFTRGTLRSSQSARDRNTYIPRPTILHTGSISYELHLGADGDWNLINADITVTCHYPLRKALSEAFKDIRRGDFGNALGELHKSFIAIPKGNPITHYALSPKFSPIPSFLHRIDDPRIPAYFAQRREWTDPVACLQTIRAICADHPDDRFLMLHLAEMEAVAGDIETARHIFATWRRRHEAAADPILAAIAARTGRTLDRTQTLRDFPVPPDYSEMFTRDIPAGKERPMPAPYDTGLDGLMRYLRERARVPVIRPAEDPIVLQQGQMFRGSRRIANLLTMQIAAKTGRTMAFLHLIQGRRKEALELLVGTYRLGQDLNASRRALIEALIGMAVRNIATYGLVVYALNACETESEMDTFAKRIDQLALTTGQLDAEDIMQTEWSPLVTLMELRGGRLLCNPTEAKTRRHASDARMANLRAAAHARLHFLRTGAFPASRSELAGLFDADPPLDPFAPTTLTISCAPTSDGCVVYNFGPDGKDEKAAVEYDPTNGTTSAGDISVRVPRNRKFPFPRNGLRAASARDVLNVFPNGLPVDTFANQRGTRLAILDGSTTAPVVIFSIGPDLDTPIPAPAPIRLPSPPPPTPTAWPFPIPSHQPVLTRAPAGYQIQCPYDPTNGSTSTGDIAVELPRP